MGMSIYQTHIIYTCTFSRLCTDGPSIRLKSVGFCLRLMVHDTSWGVHWCPHILSRPGVCWTVAALLSQHSLKNYFELRWYILYLQNKCTTSKKQGSFWRPRLSSLASICWDSRPSKVPLCPCSKGKAHKYNA